MDLPDWKSKLVNSKYPFGNLMKPNSMLLATHLADIDKRLKDLEHKVNPTAKKILSTRSQQILMLHHLGVLDLLNQKNISKKKQAKFLSILLNASPDNIEGDLHGIHNPKSALKTRTNYKVISEAFKISGMKDIAEETDKILEKIPEKIK